jgi:predicted metal-dependent enzyme (double-stranded beta helix superfamily)
MNAMATVPGSLLLHAEATFSMALLLWEPGQRTPIHDHLAWCVAAVLHGEESEVLYEHVSDGFLETCRRANPAGFVSGFAPPGDIHEVYNPTNRSLPRCMCTARIFDVTTAV